MKKIILLLLFIFLFSSTSYSQRYNKKYYGSGGFGFVFPDFGDLNRIINQFNQITPNQTKNMETFSTLFGPNFLVGMVFNEDKYQINLEFGFSIIFSSGKSSETVKSTGIRNIKDLTIRFPLINVGGMYLFKLNESLDMGPGCYINLGSMNLYSRTYNKTASTPNYSRVGSNNFLSAVGITPTGFINYHVSKQTTLSLRPGYYLMLTGQDLTEIDNNLNGNNGVDGIDNVSFSGFGIALNVLVKFGRR